ncbi:MAG: hydrogenase maturation protease, partial [Thermodesulfobacteriota bacterium]
MSSDGRLLILGLGNLLMGDDGVGVHVINSFQQESLPDGVDIVDGGTGGLDLVDIISGYRRVIVVDAVRGENGSPSGVRLFSPDDLCEKGENSAYSMHDM